MEWNLGAVLGGEEEWKWLEMEKEWKEGKERKGREKGEDIMEFRGKLKGHCKLTPLQLIGHEQFELSTACHEYTTYD